MSQTMITKKPIEKRVKVSKSIFATVIFALLIGFLAGIIMNSVNWSLHGFAKTKQTIEQTYQAQIQSMALRSLPFAAYYVAVAQTAEQSLSHWRDSFSQTSEQYLQQQYSNYTNKTFKQNGFLHHLSSNFNRVWYLLESTLSITLSKLMAVICSFWIFVFAVILGLMDGLVTRYVRTAEAGRESTFIYHKVSSSLMRSPLFILIVYLALPFSVNPQWVVVMLSVLLFGFCYLSTSQLKKYL